jgi:hypothetical protein
MTRKLLPYEHELIEILNVSEADYLEFLAVQHDFTRSREEKLQELRGDPVSIVLVVVGIILQAASYLLAPKPELEQKNQRQRRDQVFAPRFGFNSQQELAKYGDTVNLAYCNVDDNPTGGVRVATSLLWSSVHSEGSSQFMQMLLAIGASRIEQIAAGRIAFGQTPIRQFAATKNWTYFGHNRPLQYADIFRPTGSTTDPTRDGQGPGDFAYRANLIGNGYTEGFSQAFSPSTMTRCGVYAPIPINVNFYDRDEDGRRKDAELGVELEDSGSYWPRDVLNDTRNVIPVGTVFTLVFKRIPHGSDDDVKEAAAELRRSLSSYIDAASTYKLGSALFKVAQPIRNVELDDGAMRVKLECVESGICPTEDYGTTNFKQNEDEANDEIVLLEQQVTELENLLATTKPILKPGFQDAANAKLEELRRRKQQLADLTDRQWTDAELEGILDGSIAVDGPVRRAAETLDQVRDTRRDIQYQIDDQLELPRNERTKSPQQINQLKVRLIQANKDVKKAQARLDRRIERYGLADKVYDWSYRGDRRRTAKEERAWIIDSEKDILNNLYQRAAESGNIDENATDLRAAGWRNEINAKRARIRTLQNYLKNPERWNDWFNVKCLVKSEEAKYETITECRVVDFALKARVFKRVQGRAKKYGKVSMENYKISDNGIKLRSMFFWVWYRRTAASETNWQRVPYIFTIRRGSDVDNFVSLKFIAGDNIGKWQFRFEPIADTGAEMSYHGNANFAYIENSGDVQVVPGPIGGQFTFVGSIRNRSGKLPPVNVNPSEIDEWGLFSMFSDTQLTFSFDQGPELAIAAVTEQRTEGFNNYPNLYNGLSLLGFNAYSGQGIQDLRSISVFVQKGKMLRRLRNDGTYPASPDGSSSYAPDIFLDTILDGQNGIGRFAKVGGVDLQALAFAKQFCRQNKLYMDGVIAEQTPWRQFWAEVAPFSLLELGRVGGRETLVPAVPTDSAGNITRQVTISALFNQGNILEDSYKEEFIDFGSNVQDLIASVIYRDTEIDGVFPRNRSVEVSRADAVEASSVRQTFDLSQYVTNRSQAIRFGKLLCNQRRHVRRAIEFSTFPTDSVLEPGAYIYVAIGENQWDQVTTGVIEAGGALNTPIAGGPVNGSGYRALVYQSGSDVLSLSGITVSNGTAAALAPYAGRLFVLGQTITRQRVFRVTEVQMDEEGEVSVRAIEHPCIVSGAQTLSLIASFADSGFSIR